MKKREEIQTVRGYKVYSEYYVHACGSPRINLVVICVFEYLTKRNNVSYVERGKPKDPEKNFVARTRTNNKFNPHVKIEPRPRRSHHCTIGFLTLLLCQLTTPPARKFEFIFHGVFSCQQVKIDTTWYVMSLWNEICRPNTKTLADKMAGLIDRWL